MSSESLDSSQGFSKMGIQTAQCRDGPSKGHSYMPSHFLKASQAWHQGTLNGYNRKDVPGISKCADPSCSGSSAPMDKVAPPEGTSIDQALLDKHRQQNNKLEALRRKRTNSADASKYLELEDENHGEKSAEVNMSSVTDQLRTTAFETAPSKCPMNRSSMKSSRRSMSDLGFRNSKPFTSSRSRTLTLLQHPSFRHRIAHSLSLDPNEIDFEKDVCDKLSSKVEESLWEPSVDVDNTDAEKSKSNGRNLRLICSTSDLGFLKDLQSTDNPNGARSISKSPEPVSLDTVSQSLEVKSLQTPLSNFKIPSFQEFKAKSKQGRLQRPMSSSEYSVPKVETIQEEELGESSETPKDPLCSHQMSSHRFAKGDNHPQEQELSRCTVWRGRRSEVGDLGKKDPCGSEVRGDKKYPRSEVMGREGSGSCMVDDGVPVPKERKKKKTRQARNTVLGISSVENNLIQRCQSVGGGLDNKIQSKEHDNSNFKVPSSQPPEAKPDGWRQETVSQQFAQTEKEQQKLQKQSQRKKTYSECSNDSDHLDIRIGDASSKHTKETPKKSRKTRVKETILKFPLFRSQSEINMNKVGCELLNKTESVHAVLSDYATDSNAASSDSLEDVFLQPLPRVSPDNASAKTTKICPNTKISPDKPDKANLMRSVHFSDSGCLVDRSMQDLSTFSQLDGYKSGQTMWRSTSDISGMFQEGRQKKMDRRAKSCKSDPLNEGDKTSTATDANDAYLGDLKRRDSKEDILNFLDEIKSASGDATSAVSNHENKLSSTDVDRTDSGVGRDTSSPEKSKVRKCRDCNQTIPASHSPDGSTGAIAICAGCVQNRMQRKEAILEMVETELNYGKDLQIIVEQFYKPMKSMDSLLTADQIQTIFNNIPELLTVNQYFTSRLQDDLKVAIMKQDETLQSVNVGQIFLESSNMLLAYESYCINQSAAPILLDQTTEEKDLLRIFLEVTQQECTVLRRMDLKAFLMLPVQRVMKYPLLLNRIYKSTPRKHADREHVLQAQHKIENILELINFKTKGSAGVRLRRKVSSLRRSGEFDLAFENIETHKVAMETLGWDRRNIHFLCAGRLMCAPLPDHPWIKKTKTLKFTVVYGLIVTLGKYPPYDSEQKNLRFCRPCPVEDAAFVLVKEKAGKYQPFREPFFLKQCVVYADEESLDLFEIQEAMKDGLLFKGENLSDTAHWWQHTRMLVRDLCQWRHRRNALANIMLQNT